MNIDKNAPGSERVSLFCMFLHCNDIKKRTSSKNKKISYIVQPLFTILTTRAGLLQNIEM